MHMTAEIRGVKKIIKAVEKEANRGKKAQETAVKVEAYRLGGLLRKEIREGRPGGQKFEKLTSLARKRRGSERLRPDKPLSRFANMSRYSVKSKNPFAFSIGWSEKNVSKSWRNIIKRQQEGFSGTITSRQRKFFRYRGGELSDRSQFKKHFFLDKNKQTFRTAKRPIIDPFLDKYRSEAIRNIRSNFLRKMKGERI